MKEEAEDRVKVVPFEGNKSVGESVIVLEQIDKPYPEQDSYSHQNSFSVDVRAQNTSHHGEPVYLVKIESEHKNKEGLWVANARTLIGSKLQYYNYRWNQAPYNIAFSMKSSELLALRAGITIDRPLLGNKRRVHNSLPYPLELRFTLTDNNGKSTKLSVLCYHDNKITDLPTREIKQKENGEFDWWLQCDDTELLYRMWTAGKYNVSAHRYAVSIANQVWNINQDKLDEAVWKAIQSKASEVLLESAKENGGFTECFAVVDLEKSHAYALHVKLKTTTSQVDTWKLLPSPL